MKLRNFFLGFMAVTLLSACGQPEPQPTAEPAANQATDDDFPDLILPENE